LVVCGVFNENEVIEMLEINELKKEFITKLKIFRKQHLLNLDYCALINLDEIIRQYDPEYKKPVSIKRGEKKKRKIRYIPFIM